MREELKDMEKMEDVDVFVGAVEEQELPEVIEENGLVYHLAEDGCYYPDIRAGNGLFDREVWTDPGRVYVGAPST